MNYQKIHDLIISRARLRATGTYYQLTKQKKKIPGYWEVHHIVLQCQGGTHEAHNVCLTTAKEHFILHALLCYIQPKEAGVLRAFHRMQCRGIDQQQRYYSGQKYEKLKLAFSKAQGEKAKGNKHSVGRVLSLETRKKISDANLKKNQSQETLEKRSKAQLGKIRPAEEVEARAKKQRGSKRSKEFCDNVKERMNKPDVIQAIIDRNLGSHRSEEQKQNMSAGKSAAWVKFKQDPEKVKAMRVKQKEAWVRRKERSLKSNV